jgi:hypothetical protein
MTFNDIEQQELEDEYNAQFGDPRRCPHHGIATSDAHGLQDAPCWACEGEAEDAYDREVEAARRAAQSPEERAAELAEAEARELAAMVEAEAERNAPDQPW